jgi:hypothetical protein
MAIAALVISIVAALAAGASALYIRAQVKEMRRQFELTGPIIEVSGHVGLPIGDAPAWLGTLRSVKVTNKGRGEAVVQGWGFGVEGPGGKVGVINGPLQPSKIGPDLPHTVKGLDSAIWNLDQDFLERRASRDGYETLRPFVDLGDGTRVEGTASPIRLPGASVVA